MTRGPARFSATAGAAPLGAIFGAVTAAAVLGIGLLRLDQLPFPVCVFKVVTGWPCLTCGATRAFARLYALDPLGALAMNPLAVAAGLALVPWALADLALLPSGRALTLELTPSAGRWARALAVTLAVANWLYLAAVGR
ncbi:MAG TPA: DUF2752 domain-containing protein [Vicinamibacteria bacterium]